MIRQCAVALLFALAACDDPNDYLPKTQAAAAAPDALPQDQAVRLVRDIVGPCERAMDRASGAIGVMVAASPAPARAREEIGLTKTACASAFAKLQKSAVSGDVRDACLAAAYARESVADTAMTILDGQATPITLSTLQYKASDQAAASRACVSALTRVTATAGASAG